MQWICNNVWLTADVIIRRENASIFSFRKRCTNAAHAILPEEDLRIRMIATVALSVMQRVSQN
jgi:hypothetical protein